MGENDATIGCLQGLSKHDLRRGLSGTLTRPATARKTESIFKLTVVLCTSARRLQITEEDFTSELRPKANAFNWEIFRLFT